MEEQVAYYRALAEYYSRILDIQQTIVFDKANDLFWRCSVCCLLIPYGDFTCCDCDLDWGDDYSPVCFACVGKVPFWREISEDSKSKEYECINCKEKFRSPVVDPLPEPPESPMGR